MIGPSAMTAAAASSGRQDRRAPAPRRGDERPHHHRRADAIEDVDAVEVVPVPAAAEDVLLQPKQVAERDDLEAALGRRADHRRAVDLGGELTLEADRHRHADQQQEEARGDPADEARPAVGHRRLRRLVAPGVVEVGLDHQQHGQAAQPVDRIDALALLRGRRGDGRVALPWLSLNQAVTGRRGDACGDPEAGRTCRVQIRVQGRPQFLPEAVWLSTSFRAR